MINKPTLSSRALNHIEGSISSDFVSDSEWPSSLPEVEYFRVEKILVSKVENGEKWLLIKGEGYDDLKEPTWEPVHARQCVRMLFAQYRLPQPKCFVETSLPPARTCPDRSAHN
jgi:hypothetical protein